jgi:hypothetical protein
MHDCGSQSPRKIVETIKSEASNEVEQQAAKSPGGEAIPLFCRAERPSQHTDKKNIADKKKLQLVT